LDNLPDPVSSRHDPYVPQNKPAIGDMFDYFDSRAAHAARPPSLPRGGGRHTPARVARVVDLNR
jgi:hypothetical protein